MNHLLKSKYRTSFLALSIIISALIPSQAFAQVVDADWHFSCFPKKTTAIAKLPRPNILINLDISGSMNWRVAQGSSQRRIIVAKNALRSLIQSNMDAPRVDYGYFVFSSGTSYQVPCSPGSGQRILKTVDRQGVGGSTRTDLAIQRSLETSCHTQLKPNQVAATLLITDGEPDFPNYTLTRACEHRREASIYVIGLGGTTNTAFNNLMAAAGGTGQCTMGDPCDAENLKKLTKNENNRRFNTYIKDFMSTCSGSYSASNTEALLTAMDQISSKVSCTFPLETIPGAPKTIPIDPTGEYPYIRIKPQTSSGDQQAFPYEGSTAAASVPNGWTWTFANDRRTAINLGQYACNQMRFGNRLGKRYESVSTHVGCICEQTEGTQCTNDDYQVSGLCPVGNWTCDRGLDICKPMGEDSSSTQSLGKRYNCTIYGARGHCALGKGESCTGGRLDCSPKSGPMPEVCNGIDDDCDGIADNMSTSWAYQKFQAGIEALKESSEMVRSQTAYQALYSQGCATRNVCVCETTRAPLASMPEGFFCPASLVDYARNWEKRHGDCLCQSQ